MITTVSRVDDACMAQARVWLVGVQYYGIAWYCMAQTLICVVLESQDSGMSWLK